jgi:hypothetical protein
MDSLAGHRLAALVRFPAPTMPDGVISVIKTGVENHESIPPQTCLKRAQNLGRRKQSIANNFFGKEKSDWFCLT